MPVGLTIDAGYRIEDIATGRYYEIGYAEYVFLSLLDGQTSVAEAMSVAARTFRDEALSLEDVTSLIRWAAESELLKSGPRPPKPPSPWKIFGAINPLWMKIPLPSPDRVIQKLAPLLSWTQSRWMVVPAVVLTIWAMLSGLAHAGEIAAAFSGILAVSNWIPLALVWTALKIWHELGHALACHRYGLRVPNCGVIFILLAPCPYVDATQSWGLRSRWARIHIAAAGMLAEFFIAALVLIAWPLMSDGLGIGLETEWTRQLAANALFSATVATILFNANPLMKFDGYYMLSDFMNAPNLATRGSTAVQSRLAQIAFGQRPRLREPAWIEGYGWLAALWRIVVTVSLTAAATVVIPGLGLPIALVGAFLTIAPPIVNAAKSLSSRVGSGQSFARPAIIVSSASLAVIGLLCMPWPFREVVPAIVVLPENATVRAATSGFVQTVPVSIGQTVEEDTLLLSLLDEETVTQKKELEADIDRSLVRERLLQTERKLSEAQLEADDRARLRKQLALVDERSANASVLAPTTGVVQSVQPLGQRLGTYVREGDELITIEQAGLFEIEAAVQDRYIDFARGQEGNQVHVILPSGHSTNATIERIAPSATTRPVDPTLCTTYGGPIAAQRSSEEELETVRPHFPMTLRVTRENGHDLKPGLRVGVALTSPQSTATHLWRSCQDWWSDLIRTERDSR